MNEAGLKGALRLACKAAMPGCVFIRYEDIFTAGNPDCINVWNDRVTFLEVKHVAPRLRSRGLQELVCKDLERESGRCFYVMYELLSDGEKRTRVILPSYLHYYKEDKPACPSLLTASGYNHRAVAEFIRGYHV